LTEKGSISKKLITLLLKLTQFACEIGHFRPKMAIFRTKLFLGLIQIDYLSENGHFRKKLILVFKELDMIFLQIRVFFDQNGDFPTEMVP